MMSNKTMKNLNKLWYLCQRHLVLGLCLLAAAPLANADVELPRGQYYENVNDLTVKVLGGQVSSKRTWYGNQWHFNRSWNALQFTFDNLDGSVVSIDRNGDVYVKKGATFVFGTRNTIVATSTGYRWQDREGNAIDYDSTGKAIAYADRNNVKVTLQYDASGKRTGVIDHLGAQVLTYEYTGSQITAVRDAANRKVSFQYTGNNLVKLTDALGNIWTYTYDSVGKLTGIVDPHNRSTTITYNPNGRVASIKDQDKIGVDYVYDYDSSKREYYTRQASSGGKVVETWYDEDGMAIRVDSNAKTIQTTQKDGRSIIIMDARGNKTVNEYDEWNNLTKVTYADGTYTAYQYDPSNSNILSGTNERGVTNKREFDGKGNLIRVTEAVGRPEQRVTEYTYDAYGNRTSAKRLGNAVTAEAVTSYTYDDKGNVLSVTDPEGNKTQYTYDAASNLVIFQDARGKNWNYTYNTHRQLLTFTDPLGNNARYEYDKTGKVVKAINAKNKTRVFTYDAENRLVRTTDPQGSSIEYTYNPDGERSKIVDRSSKAITFEYDIEGQLSKATDGNGDAFQLTYGDEASGLNQLLTKVTYPTFAVDFKYDARGRNTQQVKALTPSKSFQTLFGYDVANGKTSVTDKEGKLTQSEYDGLGRVIKFTDQAKKVTEYAYDARDNLISLKDANGNTTRFEYDRRNLLTKVRRPLGQTTLYSYDAMGKLTQRIDAKGQKLTYSYDDAGRPITEKQYTSANALAKSIDYSYDAMGNVTSYDDGATSATYTYDDLNRKASETVNYGGFSLTYGYSYYANGQKKSYTGPDGVTYTYAYDSAGQLSSIQTPSGQITYSNYQWLAPTQVSLPGGTTQQYSFDNWMRATAIVSKDPGQNTLLNYLYTYDGMNNILSRTTEHGEYKYSYNDIYQLSQAVSPVAGTEGFTYDATGNRLTDTKVAGNWVYNKNDALTSYGNTTLEYDANGNVTRRTVNGEITDYVYDTANRLVQVKDGNSNLIAEYTYDPFGRRLSKSVASGTTYFLNADEGLVGEYDATGVQRVAYGWRPGGQWSTDPVFMRTSTGYYFYHNDHLGVPQKLTAVDGTVVWSAKYSAFGVATVEAASTVTSNLRLPGQYFDQETGLHYNYVRYYDPATGRYLQPDPIGLAGGINLYSYVNANPVNLLDPTGRAAAAVALCATPPGIVVCSVIVVAIVYYALTEFVRGCVIIYDRYKRMSDPGDNSPGIQGSPGDPLPPPPPLTTPGDPLPPTSNPGYPSDPPVIPPLPPTPATPPDVNTGTPPSTAPPVPADYGKPMQSTGKPNTLEPGPYAGEKIPARGPGRDFTPEEREKINEIGRDTGCHTCGSTEAGTKSGNFVPDHQPANALNPDNGPQDLYPHCINCSNLQGGQVRGKTR